MALRSVEYSSRILYCISDGEGVRRLNDPIDPYGSLSGLTLRRVLFTNFILHLIRETLNKTTFDIVKGAKGLAVRSIHTDCKVALRSAEYKRIVCCISLGRLEKNYYLSRSEGEGGGGGLTIRLTHTDC